MLDGAAFQHEIVPRCRYARKPRDLAAHGGVVRQVELPPQPLVLKRRAAGLPPARAKIGPVSRSQMSPYLA